MPLGRRAALRAGGGALAAAAAGPALAGCGTGTTTTGGPVTLRYSLWDQNQYPAMKTAAREFEKRNPGVRVSLELTPYAQYWTKLQTASSGGTAPDVAWFSTIFFQLYAKFGQLLPLCTTAERDLIGASHYPPRLVDAYTWKGRIYALPKDYDTIALWYNKQLFDRAGVRHPDPSWTWSDLHGAARRLTDRRTGVHGFAAELSNQSNYYNLIYQNGGYVLSADGRRTGYADPRTVEALRFAVSMIRDGSSPTMAELVDSGANSLYESGKLAMVYAGSWMVPEFAGIPLLKKYGDVAVLPKGRKRATITNGLGHCVMRTTRHPELARKLALFMSSKEACRIQARSGVVIPSYAGTEQTWLAANKQFKLQHHIDELPYTVPFPHSVNTSAWQNDEQIYLPQAWSGDDTVQDAAKKMAAAMTLDLEREAKL